MNMATNANWNPNQHAIRNRSLAEKLTHAESLDELQAMPTKVLRGVIEELVMRDIHGEPDCECDANGEA